jgi:adenosylcobinamide kinase/adenosylcobinamide-phosphate guanylyltransferase
MILIVGGEGSGKRSFAESLGYSPESMADGVLDDKPVVFHVERMVAADHTASPELLEPLCGKEVVICCEVGSGIVPAEYEQRLTREATGRLCVRLAQRADAVVRMVCGIPTVIKGKLP